MVANDCGLGMSSSPVPIHSNQMWSVPNISQNSSEDVMLNSSLSSVNNNNGTVTFQQLSSSMSMSASASSSVQNTAIIGFPSSVTAPSRSGRAITGHSSVNIMNFPRQHQANVLVNACSSSSKMSNNWSSTNQSWPNQQQQSSSLYPPSWNSQQQQRRSVPNMNALAPVAAKKQTIQQQLQQNPYSSSKFRRSTSYPNQMQQAANSSGAKTAFEFPYDELNYQQVRHLERSLLLHFLHRS